MDFQSLSKYTPALPGRSAIMEATSMDIWGPLFVFTHFTLLVIIPHAIYTHAHEGPRAYYRNDRISRNREIRALKRLIVMMWVPMILLWAFTMTYHGFDLKAQDWLVRILFLFNGLTFVAVFPPYWEDPRKDRVEDEKTQIEYSVLAVPKNEEEGPF